VILETSEEVKMELYETYTSGLTALSVALLLIAAGLAKKQLVWKRPSRSRFAVAGVSDSRIAPD
jgi:hypothetical protein